MKFLLPLAKLYEAGVRLRNGLYSVGAFPVQKLRQPVISVGNLTLGGTGKTPTVIALGGMLQESGYVVSVLLRGYKGENKGEPLLVSDRKTVLTSSRVAGDEALVIARNLPGALVVVAKNRAQAGAWIESCYSVDAHLLDDGFQHLKLYRDLNLLLVEVTNPFGGESLPPLGKLREPLRGISRADAVIFTRTQPGRDYQDLLHRVRAFNPGIPCFLARQKLVRASLLNQNPSEGFCSTSIEGCRALAFAGIANPRQFYDALQQWGVHLVDTISFSDHHRYTARDLSRIRNKCQEHGVDTAVTTEKDAENFDAAKMDPLKVMVVKIAFDFEDPDGVRNLLLSKLKVLAQ